ISTGEKKTKLLPADIRQKLDKLKNLINEAFTQQAQQEVPPTTWQDALANGAGESKNADNTTVDSNTNFRG
ncbi:MAG: hypothetical protein AAF153_00480, partial [Pseudomonadota bacterium]